VIQESQMEEEDEESDDEDNDIDHNEDTGGLFVLYYWKWCGANCSTHILFCQAKFKNMNSCKLF